VFGLIRNLPNKASVDSRIYQTLNSKNILRNAVRTEEKVPGYQLVEKPNSGDIVPDDPYLSTMQSEFIPQRTDYRPSFNGFPFRHQLCGPALKAHAFSRGISSKGSGGHFRFLYCPDKFPSVDSGCCCPKRTYTISFLQTKKKNRDKRRLCAFLRKKTAENFPFSLLDNMELSNVLSTKTDVIQNNKNVRSPCFHAETQTNSPKYADASTDADDTSSEMAQQIALLDQAQGDVARLREEITVWHSNSEYYKTQISDLQNKLETMSQPEEKPIANYGYLINTIAAHRIEIKMLKEQLQQFQQQEQQFQFPNQQQQQHHLHPQQSYPPGVMTQPMMPSNLINHQIPQQGGYPLGQQIPVQQMHADNTVHPDGGKRSRRNRGRRKNDYFCNCPDCL